MVQLIMINSSLNSDFAKYEHSDLNRIISFIT